MCLFFTTKPYDLNNRSEHSEMRNTEPNLAEKNITLLYKNIKKYCINKNKNTFLCHLPQQLPNSLLISIKWQQWRTNSSNIPFTTNGASFYEENFLCYLDWCYVNTATTNYRPSLYYRLWTNQKLQKIVFAKFTTFEVKGILLPLAH